MKQVSQMGGGNGGSQFYSTGDPQAKKPGVAKPRVAGGQARLPPGATGAIAGTTGKALRRVRDPNAPPRKQMEEVDSDIPDELLTESQKKRRRIQRMRKKRTIELALGDRKKKKEDGEEGEDGEDDYGLDDYYDEEDYDEEYDDEGEFVAPDLMFRQRSDADLLEDSETRAAKKAAREAQQAANEEEEQLLQDQDLAGDNEMDDVDNIMNHS